MATIRTAIQLQDNVSRALSHMNSAMHATINSFEHMQQVSGNAVDTASIQAARRELARAESSFNQVEQEIMQSSAAQQQFNNDIRNGQSAADGLVGKIKGIVGAYLGFQGLKKGAGIISDWLGSADVINTAETQLAAVMANMGAAKSEFESIKAMAAQVEGRSTYGAEVLLAGAGELATYLQSGKAIEAMMDTMANYAAGMGGINVDDRQMVEYATQLGKALDGQFDGLRKKGFIASEAQKKILENGTEMQRVAVINDIIAQSWDGLAQSIANTPQGQIVQMGNNFDGIKQKVGNGLYPAVVSFFNTINSNMPTIEALMFAFAYAATVVMDALGGIINTASWLASVFIDNWSWIEPIIWGIIAALVVYNSTMGIAWLTTLRDIAAKVWRTAVSWAETAAILALIVAQEGLNAAMRAAPITWIIIGVIAIIAIFYAAVAAINKFAGTSYSATGMIAGFFSVMAAIIANVFFGLLEIVFGVIESIYNRWIAFANFFGNVFNDPIASIIHLFGDLADNVLGVIEKIASALDFVFGLNLASTVAGWRSTLSSLTNWAAEKYGNGKYEVLYENLDMNSVLADLGVNLERFEYKSAWEAGKTWGAGLEDKFSGVLKMDELLGSAGAFNELNQSGSDTAKNTAKMAKSMEGSEEDLKYLRDLAERDVINRFTTAEVKVDMTNHNNVNSELDLDGIIDRFGEKLEETLDAIAEGAYQ
ncbi:hypothetical protein [Bacillus sp. S/N-304-OC-R1]|uniref:hypothetical protein n=1 Tax=Bacillus sp. S/N-304-OC-R1 TaxID=2758034 RepID=UPI001C8EC7D0|nr:hypothetical protein [Bacillus sp. S/N-304-OC-R1]MBY0124496.1 hypothetical protein [Bacillus sp. S/N-304-OC-R1]